MASLWYGIFAWKEQIQEKRKGMKDMQFKVFDGTLGIICNHGDKDDSLHKFCNKI